MKDLLNVGLYGVGRFGHALLRLLEPKVREVIDLRLFDRQDDVRQMLTSERVHPLYRDAAPIHEKIHVAEDVAELMEQLDLLILAVTSVSMREVCSNVAAVSWQRPLTIVNTAKALDYETGRRLSEIVFETIGRPPRPLTYMALAGGTIADELLQKNPLGMTLACEDSMALRTVRTVFQAPSMWVQMSRDLVGVEYAGAFKNVIAICAGMVRGLGFSLGTETHLISRMAGEVEDFCVEQMGASPKTFSLASQCWGSDLWMSCTGNTRNRALGELIGQGRMLDEANQIMARENKTVEGVQTLRALGALLDAHPRSLRLVRVARQVVFHDAPPQTLVRALMEEES